MRKFFYVLMTLFFVVACEPIEPTPSTPKGIEVFNKNNVDYYYGYAEMSVPSSVKTIYLENYSGLDADGHKLNVSVKQINVSPEVIVPNDGKNVEPFGTVKFLIESPCKTMVAAYYVSVPNVERDDMNVDNIYVLNDYKIEKVAYGAFGKTKYVQIPWDYSMTLEYGYPEDVVIYNEEHNYTLEYTYAYAKVGNGEGYVLKDAYKIQDHVIVASNWDYDMPWDAPDFVNNSDELKIETKAPARTPAVATSIKLNEPAEYITTDEGHTFYHSSGCVFFEDSWPEVNQGGVYDTDFNDCVIDYDIEARTVSDEKLETDAWRELVKVVIHLRAVGSDKPYRVGLQLEGFDQENVDYIEDHFSLDSWQNPHGMLPKFTEGTIQHMSGHYETDPMNPVVEMAHIFTMNQQRAGLGADAEYDYIDGDFINHTVFNLTYGFKPLDATQYDPELNNITSPTTLSQIQSKKWYNAIPGYVNVSGGLVTYTVIYHMKNRAEMTPEQREAAKANMIETVTNTFKQNFYIIKGDWTPVGLKGYNPVLLHNNSVNKYNTQYNTGVQNGTLDGTIPYYGTNGSVWGFKCPTLTRHLWNKLFFSQAYPHYEEWILSGGEQHQDWYHEDVNEMYLSCWW